MHDLAGAVWRKSSRSENVNECVEVADFGTHRAVRDSKNPASGHLTFTAAQWRAFIDVVRDGEFRRLI